jgi:hypothetical protein
MSEREVNEMKQLLKAAVASAGRAELQRDLWPSMLRKLSEQTVRVPWWDWALLAGTSLLLWLFPVMVPALLYHL